MSPALWEAVEHDGKHLAVKLGGVPRKKGDVPVFSMLLRKVKRWLKRTRTQRPHQNEVDEMAVPHTSLTGGQVGMSSQRSIPVLTRRWVTHPTSPAPPRSDYD